MNTSETSSFQSHPPPPIDGYQRQWFYHGAGVGYWEYVRIRRNPDAIFNLIESIDDEHELSTPMDLIWDPFFETWVPREHAWGSAERKIYLRYLGRIHDFMPNLDKQMDRQKKDFNNYVFKNLRCTNRG